MGFKEIDDTGFAFLPQRLFLVHVCVCAHVWWYMDVSMFRHANVCGGQR